jgi:hypothetical protein
MRQPHELVKLNDLCVAIIMQLSQSVVPPAKHTKTWL